MISFYNATNILFDVYYLSSYSFLQQVYLISKKFLQHRYDDILETIIYEIKSKWNEYWDMICPMHNLAIVFDSYVKLSVVLILLNAYCENMNLNHEPTKAEVN